MPRTALCRLPLVQCSYWVTEDAIAKIASFPSVSPFLRDGLEEYLIRRRSAPSKPVGKNARLVVRVELQQVEKLRELSNRWGVPLGWIVDDAIRRM